MAWTTPRTWAPGELMTAALMNAHLRDNLAYLMKPNTVAVTKHDANFTLNSTTFAPIHSTFNTPITVNGGNILVFGAISFTLTASYGATISLAVGATLIEVMSSTAGESYTGLIGALFTSIAAGTYNVSIQGKVSSGSATLTFNALNRIHSLYAIEL